MTTKEEISDWFDYGLKSNKKYLLIVCDTFDYEDYPMYALSDEDCVEKYNSHDGLNMQKVMEVYDLSLDKQSQLNEYRAKHLPKTL